MTIIFAILAYVAIGSFFSFIFNFIGYKYHWDTEDREILAVLGWIFWPFVSVTFLPIMACRGLYNVLSDKARELALK